MKYLARIVCCAAPLLFAAGICQAANQTGALLEIKGTVSQSSGDFSVSRDVDLLVSDAKIHSGVARTSPCDNISSDSYVLQGGSPTGCDNESDGTSSFETSQSPGMYTFKAAATSTQAGYQFDIQTFYTTGRCNHDESTCADPDTGFLQVTNSGPSNFVGTISLSGNPGNTDSGCQSLDSVTYSGTYYSSFNPSAQVVLALSSDSSGCGGFQSDTTSGDIQPVAPGTTTTLLPDGPLTQSITLPPGTTMNCPNTPAVAAMRDVLKLVDPLVFNPTVANGNPGNVPLFGGSSIPGPPQAHPQCTLVTSSKCAIIVNQCFDSQGNQFPDCKCIAPPRNTLIGLDSTYNNNADPKNPAYVIAQDDSRHLIGGTPGPDWTNITKSFLPGCTTPPCGTGGGGKRLNGQESIIDLNLTCQVLAFTITPGIVAAGSPITISGSLHGCPAGSSSSGLLTFTFEGPVDLGSGCTQTRISIPPPPPPGGTQGGFPIKLPATPQPFGPFTFTVPPTGCHGPGFKFSTTIKSGNNIIYNVSVPFTVQ